MRPEEWAGQPWAQNTSGGALGEGTQMPPSPSGHPHPSHCGRSLCGQARRSAEQVTGRCGRRCMQMRRATGRRAKRPRNDGPASMLARDTGSKPTSWEVTRCFTNGARLCAGTGMPPGARCEKELPSRRLQEHTRPQKGSRPAAGLC